MVSKPVETISIDTYESSVAINDPFIHIMVSTNELYTGETVYLKVIAPGSDLVALYFQNMEAYLSAGTEFPYTSDIPATITFTAEASYDGVWSGKRSKQETVTFTLKPQSSLNTNNTTIQDINYSVSGGVLTISGNQVIPADQKTEQYLPWKTYKDDVTKVIIQNGVETIGDYYFKDFSNLKEVILPESLTTIGIRAFENCEKLEKIILPKGLKSIGSFAFYQCSNLTYIVIPSGVTKIEDATFLSSGLTSIELSPNITSIGKNAFFGCNFSNIELPTYMTYIGDGAFANCQNLVSIEIPYGVTELFRTFDDCNNLQTISLPGSLRLIGGSTFENCSSLEEIKLPESLETIGSWAFLGCNNLKTVVFPKYMKDISGESIFSSCENLESIWVPDTIENIDKYAITDVKNLVHFYHVN